MCYQEDAERYIDGAVETVNARDWKGYGAFFAADVVMRVPGAIDGSMSGRAARVAFVEGIIRAFPDGRISRVRVFGVGEWGCCQFEFRGTNTGPPGHPDGSETAPNDHDGKWTVGETAPNFSAETYNGLSITLSCLLENGPVLLEFLRTFL